MSATVSNASELATPLNRPGRFTPYNNWTKNADSFCFLGLQSINKRTSKNNDIKLKYIKIGFVSCYIHWKKQEPIWQKNNSCLSASEFQSYSSNISKIFMGRWSTKKGERMRFQRNHLRPGPKGNGGPWHGWPRCGWSWHSPSPPHGPRGSTDTFLRSNSCWGYDPLRHSGGRAPNLVRTSPKDKICFMKNLYCYSVYIATLTLVVCPNRKGHTLSRLESELIPMA